MGMDVDVMPAMGRSACGLEELDDVAGWILDQYLSTAPAFDWIPAERGSSIPELIDLLVEVVHLEPKAIPTAGFGVSAGCSGSTGARCVEEESKVSPRECGEPWCGLHVDAEAETGAIELDCSIDVVDDVANTH